jgi:hypothetical protein
VAGNVTELRARLTRWRNLSALTGSLAATLLLFVVMLLMAGVVAGPAASQTGGGRADRGRHRGGVAGPFGRRAAA